MQILGKSEATAYQMSQHLLSKNANPRFSKGITAKDFCQIFLTECAKEGVRGDLAFSQACKETGYFAFKGDVSYTQNNFAGIGATGGVPGYKFDTIEEGVLAQAQHLKTYATKDDLNCECVDPRRTAWFVSTKGGTAPNIEDLGGTWAVPGYSTAKYKSLAEANANKDSYGYDIIKILENILAIKEEKMGYTNSPLVSYTKISPNKTVNRQHSIDTITIHCMAGNLTVETCGNVFSNKSRQASSNYGIGSDGRIALYVDEKDRSWCSSNSKNDHRAVTIEVANDGGAETGWHVTDKAMNALIELVADICKRNKIEKLVWSTNKTERVNHTNGCNMTVHRDFASKSCPGDYLYGKHGHICDEVNKRLEIVKIPLVAQPTLKRGSKGDEVKNLQEDLNYLGAKLSVDGSFGPGTENKLKEWQTKYGLTADGSYGPKSYAKMKELIK